MDEFKISITLSKNDLVILGRWASLGRSFDVIRQALENPDDGQAFEDAMSLIEQIEKPLTNMHTSVRSAIWDAQCARVVKKMRGYGNDYICRLPRGHQGDCLG